ncbi:MAG: GWxTD domain-containing protein [Gemmatimonadota bacterium]|nr:GWxTD domain-containing protein [Gemmatimonadota bacterium]
MYRNRSWTLVPMLAGLTFLLTGSPLVGAEEKAPQTAADTTAASGPDVEVQRALRAYWPRIISDTAGMDTRIGYARLLKTDLAGAREAFQSALSKNDRFAPAHFGMALASYRSGTAEGEKGRYSEQTIYHATRAAALSPGFELVHRLMGRLYSDIEDYENSLHAYVRSLSVDRTRDPTVLQAVVTAYIRTGVFEDLPSQALDSLEVTTDEGLLLPVVAQACASREALDLALQYYGRGFSRMPPEERLLYQDVSQIASREELIAYRATENEPAARREFLVRFWSVRDPDLMTAVNERKLEHYRRVWYSRAAFSERANPWDRRGEVYIRYGAPEYRSTSGSVAAPMPVAVERIKERVAHDIYGPHSMMDVGRGPVFPIRRMHEVGLDFPAELPPGTDRGEAPDPLEVEEGAPALADDPLPPADMSALDGDNYEVTLSPNRTQVTGGDFMSFIKWESWVYTGVAGGIEVVFTNEMGGGKFDFAPVPAAAFDEGALRRTSRMVKFSPAMVMNRSIRQMPEHYLPGGREAFLDFYYDRATFRGSNGKTRVEVYYGIPPRSLSESETEDQPVFQLGCAVALYDAESGHTLQDSEELVLRTSKELYTGKGTFIPNQLALDVSPGAYEMRVQVKDLVSGHSGIYKERLEVEDYSLDTLKLSGLELGFQVSTEGGLEKYDKGGGIWVIPMTTKTYRMNQHPFVYYEAYGLKPDTFGQSRFTLHYTIHSMPEKGGTFGRLWAGVGGLFRRGERNPEVSVSTEQIREETDLQEYFEMDLGNAKSGVNRLTVRVEDQNGNAAAEKEVLFRLER